MSNVDYVCNVCKKSFSRKEPFSKDQEILCHGCKIRKSNEEMNRLFPERKEAILQKRKNSCLAKYGVSDPMKDQEILKKQTSGANKVWKDSDRKESALSKRKETCVETYGYDAASKHPEVKKKGLDTNLERYGYVGWQNKEEQEKAQKLAHSESAEEKRKKTSLENWGETHHFKNKEKLSKQWESYKDKTGYAHPAHNPEIIHSNKGYTFEGIHFDSSWELAYYIWLIDHKKSFIYHPEYSLEYFDEEDNKNHNYYPDFLVEGVFHEIKGDQFFNEIGEPYNKYGKCFWWAKYNALLKYNVKILKWNDIHKKWTPLF